MTNSAIITKIEYKYNESDSYIQLPFVLETAKLEQSSKREAGGTVFTAKVSFKIAKISSTSNEPIVTLLQRKAIYRVTDGNSTTYTIGSDVQKARLNYTTVVEGTAGSFNGREVEITLISDQPIPIS